MEKLTRKTTVEKRNNFPRLGRYYCVYFGFVLHVSLESIRAWFVCAKKKEKN